MTSIGNEVKDGFKQTKNWVSNNIEFLSDVEQFCRQRSVIEREYANSLQRLTAEYLKKKANKTTSISVGDEPLITPGSLESSTMTTWNQILSNVEVQSSNHLNFSKELEFKISNVILQLQNKSSNLFKNIDNLYTNQVVASRDDFFQNVTKFKKQYDESCNSMESVRSKLEKKDNSKTQSKYKEKEVDMNISKNDYLIKINVANRIKDKFYYQDLPEILDLFQDLNEFKTKNLNKILINFENLEINLNNKNLKTFNDSIEFINSNKINLDTEMFIKHNSNANQWSDPADFYYIPSSIWHDDEKLVVNDNELVELKKILIKSKSNINKNDLNIESIKENLNSLVNKRQEFKSGESDNELEILSNYLSDLSKFISLENKKVESQVEIETIENNVDLSKDLSLDGLTIQKKKRGFFSKLTGGNKKNDETLINDNESILTQETHQTTHSHNFKLSSLLRRQTNDSEPKDNESIVSNNNNTGVGLYQYLSQGNDEISIEPQETFTVLNDDGSGWTMIMKNDGSQGLVPTSYIQVKKKGPEVKPRKNNQKKINYCIVKFPYDKEDEGELSIHEGEKIIIVKGDEDGWTLGENSNGERGLFPSSYIEII